MGSWAPIWQVLRVGEAGRLPLTFTRERTWGLFQPCGTSTLRRGGRWATCATLRGEGAMRAVPHKLDSCREKSGGGDCTVHLLSHLGVGVGSWTFQLHHLPGVDRVGQVGSATWGRYSSTQLAGEQAMASVEGLGDSSTCRET